jgi:hypothetical protein
MTYPPRSVSQFSSYASCSEAYRLERIEHVPTAPAAWFQQGIAAHAAIEWWEKEGRPVDGATLAGYAMAKYDRLIAEEREREPDLANWLTGGNIKPENDIAKRRGITGDVVEKYVYYANMAEEKVVASEVQFELELGGVRVLGVIDQVIEWPDGRFTPRDLKAGNKKPAWALQLAVYGLEIERRTGVMPVTGEFFMLRDGNMLSHDIPGTLTPVALGDWFKRLDDGVRGGIFLPNPGDGCRTCRVSDWCRAMGGVEFVPDEEM